MLYVITRFHLRQYVVIGNLKEYFFQIGIPSVQHVLFRILWYKDDDLEKEIETWHFTVHVCGVALSRFIASRCIHQVAKENHTHASSLTVSSLMRNMYVDDLLKSLDTIDEVRTVYRESIQLFADSIFQLTKWATNAL